MIYDSVDPEANIIFGAMVDPKMMSEVSITVLATGFSLGIADLVGMAGGEKPVSNGANTVVARTVMESPRSPTSATQGLPTFRVASKKKIGGIRGFIRKIFG